MASVQLYVLDSDVFITAKNRYYAFDVCPGFWTSLVGRHVEGRLCSIDRVKTELLFGSKAEDLVVWAKTGVPDGFFRNVDEQAVSTKSARGAGNRGHRTHRGRRPRDRVGGKVGRRQVYRRPDRPEPTRR